MPFKIAKPIQSPSMNSPGSNPGKAALAANKAAAISLLSSLKVQYAN